MEKIETTIRDYLAKDPSFLAEGLKLVQKEYRLDNAFGTRGYIDILAQDEYENFVIVEIKRSNNAARQTIHEVFKYASLLRQNLRAKDSEIRIIIVSTDWSELLVPFSAFCRYTIYAVEGFQICLDENNQPLSKVPIQPLPENLTRDISPSQLIYLYSRQQDFEKALPGISDKLNKIGISDFIIIAMSPKVLREIIIHPYAAYIAFQRKTEVEYKALILNADATLIEEIEYFAKFYAGEKEGLLLALEQLLISCLRVACDSMEAGYPQKFLAQLEASDWQINNILRAGFFASDPRLTDEMLVNEVKGLTGNSSTHYSNFSSSKSRARTQEIRQRIHRSLVDNDVWLEHIKFALSSLEHSHVEYDFDINIYNASENILLTLHKLYSFRRFNAVSPLLFLPSYRLQINYFDNDRTSLVYFGQIRWNGKKTSFEEFASKVLKDDISLIQFALGDIMPIDYQLHSFSSLGLWYSSDLIKIRNGKFDNQERDFIIKTDSIQANKESKVFSLLDFIVESEDFVRELDAICRDMSKVLL